MYVCTHVHYHTVHHWTNITDERLRLWCQNAYWKMCNCKCVCKIKQCICEIEYLSSWLTFNMKDWTRHSLIDQSTWFHFFSLLYIQSAIIGCTRLPVYPSLTLSFFLTNGQTHSNCSLIYLLVLQRSGGSRLGKLAELSFPVPQWNATDSLIWKPRNCCIMPVTPHHINSHFSKKLLKQLPRHAKAYVHSQHTTVR